MTSNEIEAAVERLNDAATCDKPSVEVAVGDLRALISAASARGVADGWMLAMDGEPCSLQDCPPGPFLYNGSLGFKTEYGASEWFEDGQTFRFSYWADAYCLESGEFFWGGAKGHEARSALIVQPLSVSAAPSSPAATPEVEREKVRHLIYEAIQKRLGPLGELAVNEAADAILALFRTPPAPAGEEIRKRFEMVVSHATAGASSDIDRSVNDICVEITQARNAIYQHGKDSGFIAGRDAAAEIVRKLIGRWEPPAQDALGYAREKIRAIEPGEGNAS